MNIIGANGYSDGSYGRKGMRFNQMRRWLTTFGNTAAVLNSGLAVVTIKKSPPLGERVPKGGNALANRRPRKAATAGNIGYPAVTYEG